MRESAGKQVARDLFYSRVRVWLTEEQILSGKILLLLGKDARELPFLDGLGIRRDNILCVENDDETYQHLIGADHGVYITREDMAQVLERSLRDDNRFVILNLDITGQYRSKLDPAMSFVLLYCCRNTQTVVATYNSIGRDKHTVWEGINSLATFLWLLPDETERLFAALTSAYEANGYEHPPKCALRELFWLRSLLEHALRSTIPLCQDQASRAALDCVSRHAQAMWEQLKEQPNRTVQLHHLRSLAEAARQHTDWTELEQPAIHVSLSAQDHVVYRSFGWWSQRCYFSKFSLLPEPVGTLDWLRQTLQVFAEQAMVFVDRDGDQNAMRIDVGGVQPLTGRTCLETGRGIYREYKPRTLPEFTPQRWLRTLQRIHTELQLKKEGIMPKKKAPAAAPAVKPKHQPLTRNGQLTSHGRSEVRRLAAEGYDVQGIIDALKLPPEETERGSLAAFVARARRVHLFVAGTNCAQSDYGNGFIAAMARRGHTLDEVKAALPKQGLSDKHVAAAFKNAQK